MTDRSAPATWEDVLKLESKWLNLGGRDDCEPDPRYRGYVSVDNERSGPWKILHDLREPFPLQDACIDRIHTEDCIHYLTETDLLKLLKECRRILKPEGFMRIAVPDYESPKDKPFRINGRDPRYPLHLTLTDKPLMEKLLAEAGFTDVKFLSHWENERFVSDPIDHSMGYIRRTREHDERCNKATFMDTLKNLKFRLRLGRRLTAIEKQCLRGKPLHITSLVIDCRKGD